MGSTGGWAPFDVKLRYYYNHLGAMRIYVCRPDRPQTIDWCVRDWQRKTVDRLPASSDLVASVELASGDERPMEVDALVRESCTIVLRKKIFDEDAELLVVVTDASPGLSSSKPGLLPLSRVVSNSIESLPAISLLATTLKEAMAREGMTEGDIVSSDAELRVAVGYSDLDRVEVLRRFEESRFIEGPAHALEKTTSLKQFVSLARERRRTHVLHIHLPSVQTLLSKLAALNTCTICCEIRVVGMPSTLRVVRQCDEPHAWLRMRPLVQILKQIVHEHQAEITERHVTVAPWALVKDKHALFWQLMYLVESAKNKIYAQIDGRSLPVEDARTPLLDRFVPELRPRFVKLEVDLLDDSPQARTYRTLENNTYSQETPFDHEPPPTLGRPRSADDSTCPSVLVLVRDLDANDILSVRTLRITGAYATRTVSDVALECFAETMQEHEDARPTEATETNLSAQASTDPTLCVMDWKNIERLLSEKRTQTLGPLLRSFSKVDAAYVADAFPAQEDEYDVMPYRGVLIVGLEGLAWAETGFRLHLGYRGQEEQFFSTQTFLRPQEVQQCESMRHLLTILFERVAPRHTGDIRQSHLFTEFHDLFDNPSTMYIFNGKKLDNRDVQLMKLPVRTRSGELNDFTILSAMFSDRFCRALRFEDDPGSFLMFISDRLGPLKSMNVALSPEISMETVGTMIEQAIGSLDGVPLEGAEAAYATHAPREDQSQELKDRFFHVDGEYRGPMNPCSFHETIQTIVDRSENTRLNQYDEPPFVVLMAAFPNAVLCPTTEVDAVIYDSDENNKSLIHFTHMVRSEKLTLRRRRAPG
jgi:hypothetical protein